ncbi:MAG: hypothetical protein HY367_02150, partial [Candidatus Aenigmarchaeota archaeon]|nr:hypothetical protein [Candidatus Aenigmarchaeota archaeon]
GQHTVTAELHQNDHSQFSPNVVQTVGFSVQAPQAAPGELPPVQAEESSVILFLVISAIVIIVIVAVGYFYIMKPRKKR